MACLALTEAPAGLNLPVYAGPALRYPGRLPGVPRQGVQGCQGARDARGAKSAKLALNL